MSYLVLARKYRPTGFADVVGQEHVLRALSHALDNERLHHAYLFSGTRGVGKTTLARILAKALNCEVGVSSTPCGKCAACLEIDSGRFVDLIEVDAASRTKVDDTRELLDNVQYAATRGRYKVYLIDEVHMLSTHSFNALLKTLEEPPDHVKFLLATTDPQKLPVTVLSRCLQFNLKRIAPPMIADRLAQIATTEGVDAEPGALRMLAKAADGSLRDALSLMDQAIAFGGGALPEREVGNMLGALDDSFVTALLDALIADDGAELINVIRSADERAPNYGALLDELARALTDIALQQAKAVDAPQDGDFPAHEYADRLAPEVVQLYYEIAVHGRRDLSLAPDMRTGVEMTLLRMLAFRPEYGDAEAMTETTTGHVPSAPVRKTKSKATASAAPTAPDNVANKAVASTDNAGVSGDDDPSRQWYRLVGALELDGVARMLAANCAWREERDDTMFLSLDKRSAAMLTDARVKVLEQSLTQHLGRDIRVSIAVAGEAPADTPVRQQARDAQSQKSAAVDELRKDAGVAALEELMDATLDPETVRAGDAG
ncbi:MAG: DNA polymerase III subunit gamma/tau [Pseudomonadota bacterium]